MAEVALQMLPDMMPVSEMEQQDTFMYDDHDQKTSEGDYTRQYLDLSNNKMAYSPANQEVCEDRSLLSWTEKHPDHWTSNEVLDWIYCVADIKEMDCTKLRGEAFQNITGRQLCRMTLQDYVSRDPVYGQGFYEMFKTLCIGVPFIGPGMDCGSEYPNEVTVKSEEVELTALQTSKLLDSVIVNDNEMKVRLGEYWYPIDVGEITEMEDILESERNHYTEYRYGSSESDTASDTTTEDLEATRQSFHEDSGHRRVSTGSDVFSDDETLFPASKKPPTQKRRNQRKKSSTSGEDCGEKKISKGRKPGQLSKGNHLWEFIRDLLKDPKFNPRLLRWEEKDTGVFRFVQSEAVAQMWGRKKNNPGMTYEKLSRAMRYYYKRGILDRVDGRRLVYKFGVNSHGWK